MRPPPSVGRRLVALVVLAGAASAAERPNVVVFLVDDMGWMDSQPYGSAYYDTPAMTRLARESMRFTQAYAQPLCSPTRASLLTGMSPARHGITSATGHQPPARRTLPEAGPPSQALLYPTSQTFLEPEAVTLAEALKAAGYRTGHFGKWHLGLTEPHWPERQGFDVAFHAQPSAGPPGNYFSPYGVAPPGTDQSAARGKPHRGTITDGPPGEYITDRLTDEAIAFLEANKDCPFFLNLWHHGVHGPWGHKEALTERYASRTDPTGRQDNPLMASMLKSVDESLGRVLAKLDELGLAENTIVLFTSDNGGNVHSMTAEESGRKRTVETPAVASYRKWAGMKPPTNNAPLRDGKGRLYEGGIRVPLMVRWPGRVAAGSTSDAVVGCVDVFPTLLELAGIDRAAAAPGQPCDGVSYGPVLTGTGTLSREAYFVWFPHLAPGVVVRRGDWKLIRRFEPRPADYEGLHELFNLRDDPSETTNLAKDRPGVVKELDALIDAHLAETGAVVPNPNPAHDPAQARPARGGRAARPTGAAP